MRIPLDPQIGDQIEAQLLPELEIVSGVVTQVAMEGKNVYGITLDGLLNIIPDDVIVITRNDKRFYRRHRQAFWVQDLEFFRQFNNLDNF